MSKHLALVASTERLWAYDAANGQTLAFGLSLFTTMVEGVAIPGDFDALAPWRWVCPGDDLPGVTVWAVKGATAQALPAAAVAVVRYPGLHAIKNSTLATGLATALESRLGAMSTAALVWDPANPKAGEDRPDDTLRHLLGSAGTAAAPIPYALNLAVVFTLSLAQVPAAFLSGSALAVDALFAAPTFSFNAGGAGPDTAAPSTSSGPAPYPLQNSLMNRWAYTITDAHGHTDAGATPVFAYVINIDLADPAPQIDHRYIDLKTYWVRTGPVNAPTFTDYGSDWGTVLAGRVADAWDLPRLMLDAVAPLAMVPQAQAFWDALAACLHDRAGLGWRAAPDGTSLVQFAFTRAADLQTALPVLPNDPRRQPPSLWRALVQGWARSLRSQLRLFDQVLTLDPATGRVDWKGVVAGAVADLGGDFPALQLGMGQTAAPPAAFSVFERLNTALADSRILAAILVGPPVPGATPLWDAAFAAGTRSTPPNQAGPDDFLDLAVAANATTTVTGTLNLADGTAWAITFAGLEFHGAASWDNHALSLRLTDHSSTAATQPVTVGVTQTHDIHGSKVLIFRLKDATGGALGGDLVSVPLQAGTTIYHVRLLLRRDTSGSPPVTNQFALNIEVSETPDDQGTPGVVWQPVAPATLPASFNLATPLTAVSVSVHNDQTTGSDALSSLPASALSVVSTSASAVAAVAPDAEILPVLQAWDQDVIPSRFDKARWGWDTFQAAIRPDLLDDAAGLDVRRRLALGNVGRVWPILTRRYNANIDHGLTLPDGTPVPPDDDHAYLLAQFVAQLTAAPFERLNIQNQQAGSLYADATPMPASTITDSTLIAAIRSQAAGVAESFAKQKLLPPRDWQTSTPLPDDSRTSTPHALTLQVDRAGAFRDVDPAGAVARDDDLLRQLAGVGVLLRQALAQPSAAHPTGFDSPWHCVNMAALTVFDPGSGSYTDVATRAVAPARVTYRDDAAQPLVTYDNTPISARSILTQFATLKQLGITSPVDDPADSLPFRYEALKGDATWGFNPALKFGQLYEILPFVVGNCQALPAAMAQGHPAVLASLNTLASGMPFDPNDPSDPTAPKYIRKVQYLRRVGVGVPRLWQPQPAPGAPQSLSQFPALPAGTIPLARELEPAAVTVAAPTALFFFNRGTRAGQITTAGGQSWALRLPRLTRPGLPLVNTLDASQHDVNNPHPIRHNVAVGLRTFDARGVPTGGVRVGLLRTLDQSGKPTLAVTLLVDGKSPVPSPANPIALLSSNEPIDVAVACSPAGVTVSWSRSGKSDTPSSTTIGWPAGLAATPPALAGAALVVDLLPDNVGFPNRVAAFSAPLFNLDPTSDANALKAPAAEPPLLLMAAGPSNGRTPIDTVPQTTTFNLRCPATDLTTWDRWYAMDLWKNGATGVDPTRKQVWAGAYFYAPSGTAADARLPDVSIDDPAVTGFFVEIVPLLAEPEPSASAADADVESGDLPFPLDSMTHQPVAIDGAVLPAPVQKKYVTLTVNVYPVGDSHLAGARLAIQGSAATVAIGEREIWELRVYPVVANSVFQPSATTGDQRFYASFQADGLPDPPPPTANPVRRFFTPWRAVIEGISSDVLLPEPASNAAPAEPEALFFGEVAATFDATSQNVVVTLVKDGSAIPAGAAPFAPRRYRNVSRLDLSRQVWRWSGRPVAPFPFEAAGDPAQRDGFPALGRDPWSSAILWDAEGFGDRDPLDLLATTTGAHLADARVELFREALANDPRALYYRFSATVTSRYAPLYSGVPLTATAFLLRDRAHPEQGGTAWRRQFAPCRFAASVPRPVVKLVVPLTQAETSGLTAPGLLVVLDEAVFTRGGLAEAVDAEVVHVTNPLTPAQLWPELGPDPILRGVGFSGGGTQPRTDPLPLPALGPIGHTFDFATTAPLFATASLVIQAPAVTPVPHDSTLAWYFARIRFRRLLLAEGMVRYLNNAQTIDLSQANPAAPVPFNLTIDQDTVITAAAVALPAAAAAATLHLSLGPRTLDVTADQNGLTLKLDQPPTTATYGINPAADLRPLLLDLRLILQRDPPPQPGGTVITQPQQLNWHVSIAFRLRAVRSDASPLVAPLRLGAWQIFQAFRWADPAHLPGALGLRWDGPAAVPPSFKVEAADAHVSPFTEPVWVQFLPDAAALLDANVVNDRGHYGMAWDTAQHLARFVVDRPGGAGTAVYNWGNGMLAPRQADGGSEQSSCWFSFLVLLTEPITDVAGRPGQERYLATYSVTDPQDPTTLRLAHLSPVLPSEQGFAALQAVRVRILEVQSNTRPQAPGEPGEATAWLPLFGPSQAEDPTRAVDSPSRIVRISQPIDLEPKSGPT